MDKNYWVVELEEFNGSSFFFVNRRDRGLAKFLGAEMASGAALSGATRVEQLIALRNLEVDKYIMQNKPQDNT